MQLQRVPCMVRSSTDADPYIYREKITSTSAKVRTRIRLMSM